MLGYLSNTPFDVDGSGTEEELQIAMQSQPGDDDFRLHLSIQSLTEWRQQREPARYLYTADADGVTLGTPSMSIAQLSLMNDSNTWLRPCLYFLYFFFFFRFSYYYRHYFITSTAL